jgi:hypothetical protein
LGIAIVLWQEHDLKGPSVIVPESASNPWQPEGFYALEGCCSLVADLYGGVVGCIALGEHFFFSAFLALTRPG